MNDAHPDDELLSASLDGDGDPTTAAHVGGCPTCRARLDALDGVRREVATPSTVAPEVAERAMAAAVRAWQDEGGSGGSVVTPLRAAAGDGPAHRRRTPSGRPSRRQVPSWVLGAAAAVVALLVAVPVVLRDGDDDVDTASAPAAETVGNFTGDDTAIDGGDLGSLSEQGTLRDQLRSSVPGAAVTDMAADPLAAPASTTAVPAAPSEGGPEATRRPTAATVARSADPTADAPSDAPCRSEVRTKYGQGLGDLLYTADLRWQDTDAVLLAYRLADTSPPGPDHRAFVMSRAECRLLVVQGF